MELTVNKAGKYALVWLTNAEKTTDLLIHNRGLEKTDDGKTTALPKQTAGVR